MTTIIDGVEVGECKHFEECETNLKWSKCLADCYPYPEGACYGDCDEHPNCYFKQLQRLKEHHHKTECEASKNLKKLVKLEQECEELKKQLESTKGLVTVGNRQLAEALLELQTYKDKEQKEKEENEKLYKKLEGSCLIGKHWRFK